MLSVTSIEIKSVLSWDHAETVQSPDSVKAQKVRYSSYGIPMPCDVMSENQADVHVKAETKSWQRANAIVCQQRLRFQSKISHPFGSVLQPDVLLLHACRGAIMS